MAPSHALREDINAIVRERLVRDGAVHGPAMNTERLVSRGYTSAEKTLDGKDGEAVAWAPNRLAARSRGVAVPFGRIVLPRTCGLTFARRRLGLPDGQRAGSGVALIGERSARWLDGGFLQELDVRPQVLRWRAGDGRDFRRLYIGNERPCVARFRPGVVVDVPA